MAYQNYINMSSEQLDKPVYRIMPVSRLLQCLEERRLVLVPPRKWDDPFENYLLSAKVKLSSTGEVGQLTVIKNKVYGQCWTLHRETDAMWRIYSPDKNGVKIRSTPRKLLESLKVSAGQFADVTCFIGKVEYKTKRELAVTLKSLDLFNTNGSGVAKSLLYKRREFSHEKEVRLIYTEGTGAIYSFDIDPNDIIEEIVFDPRLDKRLFEAYKHAVALYGYSNRVDQSSLYKPPPELLVRL